MDSQQSMTDTNSAPSIGKLALALSKAQAEFLPIVKNLEVSFNNVKYKYADLAAVIEATKAALAKNGLAVIQCTEFVGERFVMHTRLIHQEGAEVSSYWPMPTGGKPQDMGSAASYARRYSLSAILNVASEIDDDAQQAQAAAPAKKDAVKKEVERAQKAPTGGLWLSLPGDTGETHGTVGAFLDALEGHLSNADDPNEVFNLNEKTLQETQARAAKKKDDQVAQGVVGRIAAIFSHVHAGSIPGASG